MNPLISHLIANKDNPSSDASLDYIFNYTDELIDTNNFNEINTIINEFISNELSLEFAICLLTNLCHLKENPNINYSNLLTYTKELTEKLRYTKENSASLLNGF